MRTQKLAAVATALTLGGALLFWLADFAKEQGKPAGRPDSRGAGTTAGVDSLKPASIPPPVTPAFTDAALPATTATTSASSPRLPEAIHVSNDPLQQSSPLALQLSRVEEVSRAEPVLNPDGTASRVRVVKDQSFKYPLLRVTETFQPRRSNPAVFDPRPARTTIAVADHLLVNPVRKLSPDEAQKVATDLGGTLRRKSHLTGVLIVAIPGGSSPGALPAAIEAASRHPLVRDAEADYVVYANLVATDPEFAKLYALHNTGQSINGVVGTADADMDVTEAWDATTGSPSVLIGVIDTGIDWNHPDLEGQIAINPGEIPGNRVDDDNNGYVDDIRGWDFYANDNNPTDEHSHGTHVAGTIGAVANNGLGISGVMWQVGLVPLRFLGANGSGTTSDAIDAIAYATARGIKITNNSWGGGEFSQTLKDVIDAAGSANSIFVAAAGNDGSSSPKYPAAYASSNILTVAATDNKDTLAKFSNFDNGSGWVDVAAPGVAIYSLSAGNGYMFESGTSMATPNVAGVCGLIRSINPDLSATNVISWIMNSVDAKTALTGKVVSGGRVNANRAIVNNLTIPWPTLAQTTIADGGNANGIVNPGESVTLTLAIRNASPVAAAGLSATLSLATADPYVSLTTSTATLGSLAHLEAKNAVFAFQVAANAPTPRTLSFQLTTTDSAARTRVIPITVNVYTQVTATGTVRGLDGSLLSGATVAYTGPFSGSTQTDDNGFYSLLLVDGAHELTASKPGYTTTGPRVVSTPPARSGIDFVLPRPRLSTTLSTLSATVAANGRATVAIPLSNPGDSPVTYNVRPMEYGYAANGTPGGVNFFWYDISTTGTLVDTPQVAFNGYAIFNSGPYPIGMDFPYYERSYRSVRVNNRGWLSFTNASRSVLDYPVELPDAESPENMLAFAWVGNMDWDLTVPLYPAGSRRLYYQQVDPQTFVMTQHQWALLDEDLLTSQVILKRDGSIILQYGAYTGYDGTTATRYFPGPIVYIAGMQDHVGFRGQSPVYGPYRVVPNQGVAIRMYPVIGAPWMRTATTAGTLPANGGQGSLSVTFDANGLAAGNYTTKLVLDSNDAATPSLELPVTLNVSAGQPLLSWVAPAADTVITPGANVVLEVQASGDLSGLQSVNFYDGEALLGPGAVSGSNYSFTWNNPPAGAHDLRAVATFADGRALSTPVRPIGVGTGFRVRIDSLDYSTTTPAVGRHRAVIEPFGVPRVNFSSAVQSPYARPVSITRSGSLATLTLPSTHLFKTGTGATDLAFISGANQPEYNGWKTISYVNATTYTFPVSGTPATPATGSISVSDAGNATVEEEGYTLHLGGEIVRKFAYPYTVTANTVLEFEFIGQTFSDLGEAVIGIGLDSDNSLSKSQIFQLWGGKTNWGSILAYNNYMEETTDSTPSRWRHYRIPVGQHFTGNMTHLTFIQLPSAWYYGRDGDTTFRNVRLYEDPSPSTGYSFSWSFNDSATTRTGEEITQTWFTPGAKTLTVTATRSGKSATATRALEVSGSGSFAARVNFQPAAAAVPFGFVPDSGAAYADRGNGFTYGWNATNNTAVDSDYTLHSKTQERDTYIRQSTSQVWEIAVPNGTYNVFISVGLAGTTTLTTNNLLSVEGQIVVDKNIAQNSFSDGSRKVVVSDGKLTLTSGRNSAAVNFIELTRIDGQFAAPFARFTASALTGAAPVAVSFDASSSYVNSGSIVSYVWDFGDGQTATGVSTSHTFSAPGLRVVTLTVTDSTGASASSSTAVSVTGDELVPTSIDLTPAQTSASSGGSRTFVAVVKDQYGLPLAPQPAVAWSVSGGGTISPTGVFTAGATIGGPHTITASSSNVSSTAQISVVAPIVTSILVSPSEASVEASSTRAFSATVLDQFGQPINPQPSVTWSLSGGGSVSAAGVFTAGSSPGGPHALTATSGSVSGSAQVTVTPAAPIATSIVVTPATASVLVGATRQFSAVVNDQYGQPLGIQPALTWSTTAGSITQTGLLSAATTAGTGTVTAASGEISGTAEVTVTGVNVPVGTFYTISGGTLSSSGVESVGTNMTASSSSAYDGALAQLASPVTLGAVGDKITLTFAAESFTSSNNAPWTFRYGLFNRNGQAVTANDQTAATVQWTGFFAVRHTSSGATSNENGGTADLTSNGLLEQGTGTANLIAEGIGGGFGNFPTANGVTQLTTRADGDDAPGGNDGSDGDLSTTHLPVTIALELERVSNGLRITTTPRFASDRTGSFTFTDTTPTTYTFDAIAFGSISNFRVDSVVVTTNVSNNTAPTISTLANQSLPANGATGPLAFTVGDAQTAAGSLTISAASSNTTLVPLSAIVFGGSGANRTVTVTPAANQTGNATITITVSDGTLSAQSSFTLAVTPTFASWLAGYPGTGTQTGLNDDPDRDSVANALEYVFASDPSASSQAPLSSYTVAGPRLAISFPRNPATTDIDLVVQVSPDLSTWTDIARSENGAAFAPLLPGVTVSETGTGPTLQVEVIDSETLAGSPTRRFLRLRAAAD